jgi:hypothetical protein
VTTLTAVSAMSALAVSVEQLPDDMAARITIAPAAGCWLASEPHDRDGYARWHGLGFHREVWKRLVGPIPPGLVLDHREDWGCTSKACCWPMHVLPVTPRVNTLRGRSFSAINAAKDRCDHGHPFDLINTYWRPNGHRDCLEGRAVPEADPLRAGRGRARAGRVTAVADSRPTGGES